MVLVVSVSVPGCSASHEAEQTHQIQSDALDKGVNTGARIRALEDSWAAAGTDPARLPSVRETTKQILWKGNAPPDLRDKALKLLLTDESAAGQADTVNMLRLRLPTEGQWSVVVAICEATRARASNPEWRNMTAALVRSYARKVPRPEDPDRPERAALLALHPEKDLNQIVFEVFIRPGQSGAPAKPEDSAEKSRAAAWELLGRIDPDGTARTALIAQEASTDPVLAELGRSARELGVVPVTSSELTWLHRLVDTKSPEAAAWWSQTAAAVAKLTPEQRAGLGMRHLEPVRWASLNKTDWLAAPRETLRSELATRLDGRRIHRKTEGLRQDQELSPETLKEWDAKLVWGDLLAMLVIDTALSEPTVIAAIREQSEADRADTTTEYGGVLWAADAAPSSAIKSSKSAGAGFVARSYPPRPAQRVNDRTFMASEEMFSDSPRSLAHYHFHVQKDANAEYAGPGAGDLEYAQSHGRTCLVFTSVRPGVLDADVYIRCGAVIDLGEAGGRK